MPEVNLHIPAQQMPAYLDADRDEEACRFDVVDLSGGLPDDELCMESFVE